MRLLQVTNLYSPNHGGGAEAPYQLSKHLMQRGHNVTVYCSDYKMAQDYYLQGVVTLPFPTKLTVANLHITPRMLTCNFKDFDVIHLHNARTFQNIVAARYAIKYGIPYVFQAHGGILPTFQKQGLKRVFDFVFNKRILNNAVAVIAGNEAEVVEYKLMGVPEYKIMVIPPFYDTTEYGNLPPKGMFRAKYNIREKHIILFMGRIHSIKGLDMLIDTYDNITNRRYDVVLVIMGGDGGYEATLKKKIDACGLSDNVIFTGLLRGKEKLEAIVDASVLVQPSVYERGAGSPFEAVLCGTPIIVTSGTGAGRDVEKIDAGYLVEHGDITEFARLINKSLDAPAEIQGKAKKAGQYIRENLSWAKGINQYGNLYKAVTVK